MKARIRVTTSTGIMTSIGNFTVHASPDKRMECISVGHPADEARVGGQRNDSIARNAEVPLSCGPVVGQHVVDQAEQLHNPLILPQILMALHNSNTVLEASIGVCISRVLAPGSH